MFSLYIHKKHLRLYLKCFLLLLWYEYQIYRLSPPNKPSTSFFAFSNHGVNHDSSVSWLIVTSFVACIFLCSSLADIRFHAIHIITKIHKVRNQLDVQTLELKLCFNKVIVSQTLNNAIRIMISHAIFVRCILLVTQSILFNQCLILLLKLYPARKTRTRLIIVAVFHIYAWNSPKVSTCVLSR